MSNCRPAKIDVMLQNIATCPIFTHSVARHLPRYNNVYLCIKLLVYGQKKGHFSSNVAFRSRRVRAYGDDKAGEHQYVDSYSSCTEACRMRAGFVFSSPDVDATFVINQRSEANEQTARLSPHNTGGGKRNKNYPFDDSVHPQR